MKQKSYTAFGLTFSIQVYDEALWPQIEQHLPPGSQENIATPSREYVFEYQAGQYCLLVEGVTVRRYPQLNSLLDFFEGDLQIFVAEFAPAYIFVHAGVIGWKGEVYVFPGRSRAGKSTLIAALLKAGAQYFSDEYAAIDADGFVHSYPRRISQRQQNGGTLRTDVRDWGVALAREPLRIGKIFVCRFELNARWHPRTLTPGEALLAMLNNTVAAQSKPAAVMEVLSKVVVGVTALESVRGEADDCISAILT